MIVKFMKRNITESDIDLLTEICMCYITLKTTYQDHIYTRRCKEYIYIHINALTYTHTYFQI